MQEFFTDRFDFLTDAVGANAATNTGFSPSGSLDYTCFTVPQYTSRRLAR